MPHLHVIATSHDLFLVQVHVPFTKRSKFTLFAKIGTKVALFTKIGTKFASFDHIFKKCKFRTNLCLRVISTILWMVDELTIPQNFFFFYWRWRWWQWRRSLYSPSFYVLWHEPGPHRWPQSFGRGRPHGWGANSSGRYQPLFRHQDLAGQADHQETVHPQHHFKPFKSWRQPNQWRGEPWRKFDGHSWH